MSKFLLTDCFLLPRIHPSLLTGPSNFSLSSDTDERSIVFRSPSPIEHHDALFVTVHIRTQKEQHEIFDRELALAEKRRVNSSPTEARLSPVQLPIIGVVSPVADWFLLIFDPSKERTSITPFTQRQAKYAQWIWSELERHNRSNPAICTSSWLGETIVMCSKRSSHRPLRSTIARGDLPSSHSTRFVMKLEQNAYASKAHRLGSNAFLIWHKKSTWSTLSPHKTTKGECTRAKNRHAARHTHIE